MNRVASLLSAERIRIDCPAATRNQLFEEAARLFAPGEDKAQARIVASLSEREKLGSTGLGHGVAIPHARVKGLDRATAAFLRPSPAVQFSAPDRKPVSEVLVLLLPPSASEEHLKTLADAARMFSDRGFMESLRRASLAAEIYQAFVDWQAPPGAA